MRIGRLAVKKGGELDQKLTRVAEEEVTPALLDSGTEDEDAPEKEEGEEKGRAKSHART